MPRKTKFNPQVTRIKLNPEQAVLTCLCYNTGTYLSGLAPNLYVTGDASNYTIRICFGSESVQGKTYFYLRTPEYGETPAWGTEGMQSVS